ncbi:hypothetical protein BD410DRAFT_785011 [Rickenella mellea]|uniref:F-box domain-containing protein n=1 Tax=Rickenella mellea TaxID=50990 RepID=A0A4Y7QE77_9AGAM|nr:hypothetical protein BD410DRAFT_785011 [Rickenella mellea]
MDDLNDLLRLLQVVKETGWEKIFKDTNLHVWRTSSSNENSFSYPDPLFSMRCLLEDSKRCMKALNTARQNLGMNIRALEKRCMHLVFEDGITRLPNELLARIFELGHHMTKDCKFALRVSHVSRRFRDVSLGTPLLWSRLAFLPSVNLTREFISRAGPHDLDISTYKGWGSASKSKMTSFLSLVAPLSNQWSRLTIFDIQVEDEINSLGLHNFPSLSYLGHSYTMDLSTWTMPLLRVVGGHRATFTPGVPYMSQLTTVDMLFDLGAKLDVPSLARALHAMPNLQHLFLELWHCLCAMNVTPLGPQEIPERHSVNIQTLQISVKGLTRRELIQDLYDALAYFTPSTVNISLTFDFVSEDPEDFKFLHTSDDKIFPHGSTIQITIFHHPAAIFYTLWELTGTCDIVSSVQLEIPDAYIDLHNYPKISSIRHLRFRNCDTLAESDVETLTKKFTCLNDGGLESLEFIYCKKLSEEFLLDLKSEFGEKVKWII